MNQPVIHGMVNLDTHILIYFLQGTLTKRELKLIGDLTLCISGVVLWEIFKLKQIGRIEFEWNQEILLFIRSLVILPMDASVFLSLPELDFRSDPIDEIIAATSIAHSVPLLTRDKKILKSKVVPLAI